MTNNQAKGCQVLLEFPPEKDIHLYLSSVAVLSSVTCGQKNPLWFGLAARLKSARQRAGLSHHRLGVLAGGRGVPESVESGERVPGIDTVEKLATTLGVPACWLAFGDDGKELFRKKIRRQGTLPAPPEPQPAERPAEVSYAGVGRRIAAAREAAGLSMRELGRRAELSVQAVSLLESGRAFPRVDSCEALALALEVAPCWLAYGVGRGPASDGEAAPGARAVLPRSGRL
jgi:transcriptional regulator with XRE-family HTH domain